MATYTALIAAWNNATQPPTGITGTALTGLTTANKLIAINGWTVTGTVPTSTFFTGAQLMNCMNWTEFNALTAAQQSNLLAMCQVPGNLLGGSANTAYVPIGMIVAYFSGAGTTIANLTALGKTLAQPWWSTPVASGGGGLSSQVSTVDLVAAGNLT